MTYILRCDIAGTPLRWISPQDAVRHYAMQTIAWVLGDVAQRFHGGRRARDGLRTVIDVSAIISVHGPVSTSAVRQVPPLSNSLLFARDQFLCLYCGQSFSAGQLTRDHVVPRSRGGEDTWENLATACRACNQRKADRTPAEARMPLLAVPYTPQPAEYLILSNRRIIGDQMSFLRSRMRSRRDKEAL